MAPSFDLVQTQSWQAFREQISRWQHIYIHTLSASQTNKLKTIIKETQEDMIDAKIPCAHRLEELSLWKRPRYPKISTDSVQSLLKCQ